MIWSSLQAFQAVGTLCQTLGIAVQTEETIGPLCLRLDLPPSFSKVTEFLKQSLLLWAC